MKAIFFDLDDTLYDRSRPFLMAFERYFEGRYRAVAREAYEACNRRSHHAIAEYNAGHVTRAEEQWLRYGLGLMDIGIEIDRAQAVALHAEYKRCQKHISTSETVMHMLEECEALYSAVGVITNGEGPHQREKLATLGLGGRFREALLLISAEKGIMKPDRRIFDLAAEAVGGVPCVFVGDSYEVDIVGAKGAGFTTIWFDRDGRSETGCFPAADRIVRTEEALREAVRGMA